MQFNICFFFHKLLHCYEKEKKRSVRHVVCVKGIIKIIIWLRLKHSKEIIFRRSHSKKHFYLKWKYYEAYSTQVITTTSTWIQNSSSCFQLERYHYYKKFMCTKSANEFLKEESEHDFLRIKISFYLPCHCFEWRKSLFFFSFFY